MILAHLRYLWYVLRHKYHVYVAGRALGLPIGLLLAHDLSKFSAAEWGPYVAYQSYHGRPQDAPPPVRAAFDAAWAHHWRHNPHHPQFWAARAAGADELYGTDATMPLFYVEEMVADWYGAGMANGRPDMWGWYRERGDSAGLDPAGHAHVVWCLEELTACGLIVDTWGAA